MLKSLTISTIWIGLLTSYSLNANESSFDLIHKAERLFEEQLYTDASPLYEKAISLNIDLHPTLYHALLINLAYCYLETGENHKLIALLHKIPPDSTSSHDKQIRYLLAQAYRHTGQYQEALQCLQSFPTQNSISELVDEYQLEIGLNYFQLNQYENASLSLQTIPYKKTQSNSYILAQLYLVRIDLIEKNYVSSQTRLKSLTDILSPDDPLSFELAYLKGLTAFYLQDYKQALNDFERALPSKNKENCSWYIDTLYHIGLSCLRQIQHSSLSKEASLLLFNRAELALLGIPASQHTERSYLALGEIYANWAKELKDENAYQKAQLILKQENVFITQEGRNQALLLQAAAAPNYLERLKLYQILTQEDNQSSDLYPQVWYWKGINEYEEGLATRDHDPTTSKRLLHEATSSFAKASSLLRKKDPFKAFQALKYEALAYYGQQDLRKRKQAWDLLLTLLQEGELTQLYPEPEELYYLAALVGDSLQEEQFTLSWQELEQVLIKGLTLSKESRWNQPLLKTISLFYLKNKQFSKADDYLKEFIVKYPQAPFCGEALFWRALCAEQQEASHLKEQYLQETYSLYPESPYAPLAYFKLYSYQEYLGGSRKAIKHLQAMDSYFSKCPLLMTSYYLIGLDYKKDRLSKDGKLSQHKNLTAAIDSFQKVETTFDTLYAEQAISENELFYFTQLRYQANLERALANLAIAQESKGSKRHIYLEYAIEVFQQLRQAFDNPTSPAAILVQATPYPRIWEESDFYLAKAYLDSDKEQEAERIFNQMLDHYKHHKQDQNYFLSRLWYEKGKLAQRKNQYHQALDQFRQAEASFSYLSSDEKLELWIEQSACYRDLGQFEQAMQLLSKVVNEETISGLRIKAMFLRAEIYEREGKPELALKQLEATSKKGGEWGLKAKKKLEQNF